VFRPLSAIIRCCFYMQQTLQKNFMCSTEETLHVSALIDHHQVLWTDNGLKFFILLTHRPHKPSDFISVICCSLYLLH
jgi:hypothetical protein